MPTTTLAQLESIRRQALAGQPCWGDGESRIPVDRYFADDVWQREIAGLFRRLPLIAAHSSELKPGEALAHDAYGVPLVLTRDAQGRVRAMLNVCRHRGMRLLDAGPAQAREAMVCPYHGWSYRLDGTLRHRLHAETFDACPAAETNLVQVPAEERHGLVWVVPDPDGTMDLDTFLGGLNDELPSYALEDLRLFRQVDAEYPANWKLIVDAFLESYHIRVLHKDTIWPFFTDGITAAQRFGPHISSLVARRNAVDWAKSQEPAPQTQDALRRIVTPSHVIFPNTITIFHPDYLSLVTLYPVGPEKLRWCHRMLVPASKMTPDWAPHWEKTFALIEKGVFQKEDIHCAVQIQAGMRTGANQHLRAGRMEQALGWFHGSVAERVG